MENIINLSLDVGNQVDVVHNKNLEALLTVIGNDDEHEAIVRVQELLIEGRDGV